MATGTWTNSSRRTVVGYFAEGENAHRAINDLVAEGFRPSEIGAAFHSSETYSASDSAGIEISAASGVDRDIHPVTGPKAPDAGSTTSGAASDSSAVTPAGLSTGAGTASSGAGRPGPIPGSEIPSELPSTLPHTIHSTLPSTLHPNPEAPLPAQAADSYPATGSFHEAPKGHGPNWWEKLKNVFGGDSASSSDRARREVVADDTSTNFGTGEGHLGAYPDYDYAYSGAAFESAFFGMGIPPAHAKQLSGRIRRGGAIVTVDAGTMNADAERILERNGGVVRYEAADAAAANTLASEDARDDANREGRVQLFGRVQRVYPGYVSSTGSHTRKAS